MADRSSPPRPPTSMSTSMVSDDCINNNFVREKILSGAFKLITKRGRSRIWEMYARVLNTEGVELKNVVACRSCLSVLRFQGPTSNLNKHRCYAAFSITKPENGGTPTEVPKIDEIRQAVLRLFSQWSIDNCRLFQLEQEDWVSQFARFMINIGAKYGSELDVDVLLPKSMSIEQHIGDLYELTFNDLRSEIYAECHGGYGLSTHIWSVDAARQDVTVALHFVKRGHMVSRLLGIIPVEVTGSSRLPIKSKIQKLLKSYGMKLDDAVLVADRAGIASANIGDIKHIFCVNHLLSSVVETAMQRVKEVADLRKVCMNIDKYLGGSRFHGSHTNGFLNTYYLMLTIEQSWQEKEKMLQGCQELQKEKDLVNLDNIRAILQILRPFEEASRNLANDKFATLHLVYAYINGLKETCAIQPTDMEMYKQFKRALSEQIKIIVMPNLTIIHKIALFLFPPANKLLQFSREEKDLIKAECTRLVQPYNHSIKEEIEDDQSENSSGPRSSMIISSFFKDFVTPSTTERSDDKFAEEMHLYETLNVPFEDNFNPLMWWHIRQSQFPLLYNLSCKILAIPASSSAADGVSIKAKRMMDRSPADTSCNSSVINNIMFLNFYGDKEIKEDIKNYEDSFI